jgi:hypothetical protein
MERWAAPRACLLQCSSSRTRAESTHSDAAPSKPEPSPADADAGPGGADAGEANASDGNDGNDAGATVACVPAAEDCDGKDNDCDGKIDEGVKTRCWADADGDGYAVAGAAVVESCDACGVKQTAQEPVAGKVDCDDASAAKSPGATDICGDSIDNDCDGKPDDDNNNACGGPCTAQLPGKPGDGCNNGQSGACARPGVYECRPDHTMACTAPMVPPAAAEVCGNGKDDDCKNGVDDGCVMNACGGWTKLVPAVGGSCMVVKVACSYPGKYVCAPGSTDATACGGQPPVENCSTDADDNCDGRANEDCCVASLEVCGDGKDNDCNGKIDDGKNECGMPCGSACPPVCVPSTEICGDGKDNDCNGKVDDGSVEKCDGKDNDCDGIVDNVRIENLVRDPGFEGQQVDSIGPPWDVPRGVYVTASAAHSGSKSVTVVGNQQNGTSLPKWNNVSQIVTVKPGKSYKLDAWVKTSPNVTYGRIGARALPNWMLELSPNWGFIFSTLTEYTKVSTVVQVPADVTQVDIYVGVDAPETGESATIAVDDVLMVPQDGCNQ